MTIQYFGYNPPFFGGHQNVLSRQSGDRLIKNDLLQLLLTSKGERVMRPTWGTNLKASIFGQSDNTIVSQVSNDLANVLSLEPRVQVRAAVQRDDDNHILNVVVAGTYTDQPNTTLEIELNIPLEHLAEK